MTNDGASFTEFTVIVNDTDADELTFGGTLLPLSVSETMTRAEPLASAAGVNVSTPLALSDGATANRPGLLPPTTKVSVWPASFAGPAITFVAHGAL